MTILQNIFTTALWGQLGAMLWAIIQSIFGGTAALALALLLTTGGCCFNLQMGWKNTPCEVPVVEEPAPEQPPAPTPGKTT